MLNDCLQLFSKFCTNSKLLLLYFLITKNCVGKYWDKFPNIRIDGGSPIS